MRLIDAGKLECVTGKVPDDVINVDDYIRGEKDTLEMLDAQPTVDAVPVVRCKDCKHGQPMIYRHTERPCIMCSHLGSGFFARVFNPDWYCADGERRESE